MLRQADVVSSIRGAQGGYILAHEPDEIIVGTVIRALEGSMAPAACAVEGFRCRNADSCVESFLYKKIRQSIDQVIDHITLGDMLRQEREECLTERAVSYTHLDVYKRQGMERLLLVMQAQNVIIEEPSRCDVFVHTFGDVDRAFALCMQLRRAGVKAEFDPLNRSTKAQMRYAEKLGATNTSQREEMCIRDR